MTMEKYGVSSVPDAQREALGVAKAKLLNIQGGHEKTASEEKEESALKAEIAELEVALLSQ